MLEIQNWNTFLPLVWKERDWGKPYWVRHSVQRGTWMDMESEREQGGKSEARCLSSGAGDGGSTREFLPCQLLLIKTSPDSCSSSAWATLSLAHDPGAHAILTEKVGKFPAEPLGLYLMGFWAQIMRSTVFRKNQVGLEAKVTIREKKHSLVLIDTWPLRNAFSLSEGFLGDSYLLVPSCCFLFSV